MRASAAFVLVGLLLLVAQVAFSDGATPRLVALPIGMLPVTLGGSLLLVGLVLGLFLGNGSYRGAVALGFVGTLLFLSGLLFLGFGGGYVKHPPLLRSNEVAVILGLLVWVVALVLGARALRASSRP
jgi:hypothetical protein